MVSTWKTDAPALLLLAIAFTMSVPMAAWMRYRGHGWAPVLEMTGSMFVPTLVAIGLLWGGLVDDTDTLLLLQHVGMFPGMLLGGSTSTRATHVTLILLPQGCACTP